MTEARFVEYCRAHVWSRFMDSANVVEGKGPGVRFYAGSPLMGSNGHRLGSLCMLSRDPRSFTAQECIVLANFAGAADRHRL